MVAPVCLMMSVRHVNGGFEQADLSEPGDEEPRGLARRRAVREGLEPPVEHRTAARQSRPIDIVSRAALHSEHERSQETKER